MSNIHYFPDNHLFKLCGHGPMALEEERGKAWLGPDSLVNNNFKLNYKSERYPL
jgi:hypothetical protein